MAGDFRNIDAAKVNDACLRIRCSRSGQQGQDSERLFELGYEYVRVDSILEPPLFLTFYREHEPAHFHAEHQAQNAKFDFSGKILAGHIQSKIALRLIREWAILHRVELEANWANMKAGKPLEKIPPLE